MPKCCAKGQTHTAGYTPSDFPPHASLSIQLITEQVFLAVIFNSLKLPIFPPCQTAGVFSSLKILDSSWVLLAGMQALQVRARQGVQHSTQPRAPEQSGQDMQQSVSRQARGPSCPTQPTQSIVTRPYMPLYGQSAYWPTCPHPYPPLPLPGRFQTRISEQYVGSSQNYFSCQFFLQFMGTSCSYQGILQFLKIPLSHFPSSFQRGNSEKVLARLSVLKPEPQSTFRASLLVSDLTGSCSNAHLINAGQQLPSEKYSYGKRSDLIQAEHNYNRFLILCDVWF